MKIQEQVAIQASPQEIWRVITDIENSIHTISGIEKVEVLEKPEQGLVGLKWRETRTMFGSTATEVMWITEAVANQSYKTRAESHGAIYRSQFTITERDGSSLLTMTFDSEPQTFSAKLMGALMGWMIKGSTAKAVQQDLQDIKAAVEGGSNSQTASGEAG